MPIETDVYWVDEDLQPARLTLVWGVIGGAIYAVILPAVHVTVEYVCGYPTNAIPQPILSAIMVLTAFLYENRGDGEPREIPRAVYDLLNPYRLLSFGS